MQEIICKFLTRLFGVETSDILSRVHQINDQEVLDWILAELFTADTLNVAEDIIWKAMGGSLQ